jgi:hypothetical protein
MEKVQMHILHTTYVTPLFKNYSVQRFFPYRINIFEAVLEKVSQNLSVSHKGFVLIDDK